MAITPTVKYTHRKIRATKVEADDADFTSLKQNSTALVDSSGNITSTGRITTTDGVASGTARVVGGRAYSLTAAGTALTNSTSETVLASHSIPANTIGLGTVVKIRYQIICSTTTGATTLIIRLRMGATTLTGTAIITSSTVDAADSNIVTGYAELVGRAAAGAAAAMVGVTMYSQLAAAGGAVLAGNLASTNFATNGALLVEVTGQWSAADANSCRADVLNIEII